ncbi:hypothetical protein V1519DRAFT_494207 [Lipomyces tetrasporus]
MLDVIRASFGGNIIHLLSDGRPLPYPDLQPGFIVPSNFGVTVTDDLVPSSTLSSNDPVEWYGPDDPENPPEICIFTFSVYIGSAIYTPSIEDHGRIAPLLIGRNWIYTPSLLLFAVLQIPTALVKNIGGLIAVRAITGFVSSPHLPNGGPSIGHVVSMNSLSCVLALWSISAVFGPVTFPRRCWRWTFWSLSWISGQASRARRLGKLTGDDRYTTKAEQEYADFPCPLIYATGLSYFGTIIGASVAAMRYARPCTGAPPETIFRFAIFAAPILAVSLFMFGWSYTAGLFLLGGYTVFRVVLKHPRFLASVLAGNDFSILHSNLNEQRAPWGHKFRPGNRPKEKT